MRGWPQNLLAVGLILGVTTISVQRIAAAKNEALAGPGAFRLDDRQPAEMRVFSDLLDQLGRCDESGLSGRMRELQRDSAIWIAPALKRPIRAVFVDSLGLVRRIYIARGELMDPVEALFPNLDVPEEERQVFGFVTFVGTLQHELEHYQGVVDEGVAYDREVAWYEGLRKAAYYRQLGSGDRRVYEWAIAEAIVNARRAQALATAD